jgi:hypothetical protein
MKRRDEKMKTKKKVFTRLAVLLLLLMAAVPTASAGWDYYREIEINNGTVSGSADLSSFPVLIDHAADWLQRADSGDHVRRADGYDIVFTDSVNANKLDFEIEEYNGTAGTLVAWVRIPTLDHDANTSIRLYYGNSAATDWSNPTGVWDTNYKAVWHLKETTGGAGAIKDSTSNDNDGTDYGSPNLDVAGQIDGADAFDGTDDYLSAGTTNFEMQRGTYSAWVNFDNWANNQNDVLFSVSSEAAATSANLVGYWRRLDVGGNTIEDISGNGNNGTIYGTGGTAESGTANTLTDTDQRYMVGWGEDRHPTLNKWYHICLTYDGLVVRLFVNGVEEDNKTVPSGGGSLVVKSHDLSIGSDAGAQKFFNGTIDEVRFYDAAISEDRIRSRYLGALSAHKNADNNLVMHFGPATMTTDVSGLSGWHHVAGTYDNNDKAYLYLDGVEKVNTAFSGGTHSLFGDYSYFANDENDQMQSAGKMDEFRVSASARSGDWINTSHNNQNSPSTFYSVAGTATSTGGSDPVPELPTVILFAVGLVVLVGYVWLGRKNK